MISIGFTLQKDVPSPQRQKSAPGWKQNRWRRRHGRASSPGVTKEQGPIQTGPALVRIPKLTLRTGRAIRSWRGFTPR